MTPDAFISKWSDSRLRERQGSQEHFIDLCRLLGEPTPADSDQIGDTYCFDRGATKVGGGDGWPDVWRKDVFGWEYKGPHKDLNAALRHLQIYAPDLQNPPYLVVSDMARIVAYTNWTNTGVSVARDPFVDMARRSIRYGRLRSRASPLVMAGLVPAIPIGRVRRIGGLRSTLRARGRDGHDKPGHDTKSGR